MNTQNENEVHQEKDTAKFDSLDMTFPLGSETDWLYWIEFCPLLRRQTDKIKITSRKAKKMIDLWKSYGRQHPSILRQGSLNRSVEWSTDLEEFFSWSWDVYIFNLSLR